MLWGTRHWQTLGGRHHAIKWECFLGRCCMSGTSQWEVSCYKMAALLGKGSLVDIARGNDAPKNSNVFGRHWRVRHYTIKGGRCCTIWVSGVPKQWVVFVINSQLPTKRILLEKWWWRIVPSSAFNSLIDNFNISNLTLCVVMNRWNLRVASTLQHRWRSNLIVWNWQLKTVVSAKWLCHVMVNFFNQLKTKSE